MATIVRTPSETWKAIIRKQGWPTTAKTFRTKRDAEDWARRAEDEMVRGIYIERGASERLTLAVEVLVCSSRTRDDRCNFGTRTATMASATRGQAKFARDGRGQRPSFDRISKLGKPWTSAYSLEFNVVSYLH